MRDNLELLVFAALMICAPVLTLTCLTAVVWFFAGTSWLASFGCALGFSAASIYGLYVMIKREVSEFNIELDMDDDTDNIA